MEISKVRFLQRCALDWVVRHHPNLGLDERAESFVQLFEKYIPQSSRVLDVGGGWGYYYHPLVKREHEVCVLDVVKPGIQQAPVFIYDGNRMPFKDNAFDVSLLITVMHHIPDLDPIIEEIKRVTRKTLIVVEDVYHHSLGRVWTKWRDQLYNFEFFGHPGNFKKSSEWIQFFEQKGLHLKGEEKVYTWLSGLRILNAVFAFNLPECSLEKKQDEISRQDEARIGAKE